MKITVHKRKTAVAEKFNKTEWKLYSKEHYGKDSVNWDRKLHYVKATIGREVVGLMKMRTEGGIGEIFSIIVSHKKARQGIGKKLMKKAEEIAKKEGVHKLCLMTGTKWNTLPFYKSLGYSETRELKNHYFHTNFIELVKFIK